MTGLLRSGLSKVLGGERRDANETPGKVGFASLGHARARGFTLLEVLIAFVIAALSLGIIFRSVASSLASVHAAAQYEEALGRAQSRLTLTVHGSALMPGDQQGDDGGGYRWRVRITQVASTATGLPSPHQMVRVPVTLYAVSVWVWWGEEDGTRGGIARRREVRLDTQHVAPALP